MKKIFALALTLLLALSSVCALGETALWSVYENDELGYTIEYPENWLALDAETIAMITVLSGVGEEVEGMTTEEIASMAKDKNIVTFISFDEDGFNFSVDVSELGIQLSASILSAVLCPEVTGQMKAYMPGVSIIEEGDVVTVNGKSYAHIHMGYVLDGVKFHSEQYYISNGSELVTITLTCSEAEYAGASEIVKHALGTLSFR